MTVRPPLPAATEHWALFLDFDGTLVPIAARPRDVRWRPQPAAQLQSLAARLDGALAVISGRSVADLGRILQTNSLLMAGVHGLELRDWDGRRVRAPSPDPEIASIVGGLQAWARFHPGVEVEDKGLSVAVHYRRAPHLCGVVRETLAQLASEVGPRFVLQPGKLVLEIRIAGADKGSVIAEIMQTPPFDTRTPVYLGDDATDEAGFAQVNRLGGLSVKVGTGSSCAHYRLRSVADVWLWLRALDRALESRA